MYEELIKTNTAKEETEIAARKELLEKEKHIREEAERRAAEDSYTKIHEQEETINKSHESLPPLNK